MTIERNVPLKKFSHYQIGGPASYFFEFKNLEDLEEGLKEWRRLRGRKPERIFVLGNGTNTLFGDKGYKGLVIRNNIAFSEKIDQKSYRFGAACKISEINDFCIKNSLSGLEWSGGLPGTLGGAIFGNAGAFGGEIKDVVLDVTSYSLTSGKTATRKRSECLFGYRTSIFKKRGDEVILSATLSLKKGEAPLIKRQTEEKIAYRELHQPLEYPNIGSMFKNVNVDLAPEKLIKLCQKVIKTDPLPVIPVAHLINEAMLSGKQIGGAMVSKKHPNFIINYKNATSKDVEKLIKLVQRSVKKKFNVEIEPEVIRVI